MLDLLNGGQKLPHRVQTIAARTARKGGLIKFTIGQSDGFD